MIWEEPKRKTEKKLGHGLAMSGNPITIKFTSTSLLRPHINPTFLIFDGARNGAHGPGSDALGAHDIQYIEKMMHEKATVSHDAAALSNWVSQGNEEEVRGKEMCWWDWMTFASMSWDIETSSFGGEWVCWRGNGGRNDKLEERVVDMISIRETPEPKLDKVSWEEEMRREEDNKLYRRCHV